jgi:hypothetical protein
MEFLILIIEKIKIPLNIIFFGVKVLKIELIISHCHECIKGKVFEREKTYQCIRTLSAQKFQVQITHLKIAIRSIRVNWKSENFCGDVF